MLLKVVQEVRCRSRGGQRRPGWAGAQGPPRCTEPQEEHDGLAPPNWSTLGPSGEGLWTGTVWVVRARPEVTGKLQGRCAPGLALVHGAEGRPGTRWAPIHLPSPGCGPGGAGPQQNCQPWGFSVGSSPPQRPPIRGVEGVPGPPAHDFQDSLGKTPSSAYTTAPRSSWQSGLWAGWGQGLPSSPPRPGRKALPWRPGPTYWPG